MVRHRSIVCSHIHKELQNKSFSTRAPLIYGAVRLVRLGAKLEVVDRRDVSEGMNENASDFRRRCKNGKMNGMSEEEVPETRMLDLEEV